jgi:hypothetical protein
MSPFAILPAAAANRGLGRRDWAVLHAIALHADKDGCAYPSLTTIAKVAGVLRNNVPKSIRKLEQLELLERKAERQPGARWSNTRYRVLRDSICGDGIQTANGIHGDAIQAANSIAGDAMNSIAGDALTDHRNRLLPRKGVCVGKEKVANSVPGDAVASRCGFYMTNATGFRLCDRPTVAGVDRCAEHSARNP